MGAPRRVASVENEYCVFAMQTGSPPYPSFSRRSIRRLALLSQVTIYAP